MSIHLVWFRDDLRLHDHEPLVRACQAAEEDGGVVVPVHIVDPRFFGETSLGCDRVSPRRRRFLRESLADLAKGLNELGSGLQLWLGETESLFEIVFETASCTAIYFHHGHASEERVIRDRVCHIAGRLGVRVDESWSNHLVSWDELPFGLEQTPELFTDFRRQVEKHGRIPSPMDRPRSMPSTIDDVELGMRSLSIEDIDVLAGDPPDDSRAVLPFRGGESEGLRRLRSYLWDDDLLRTYKTTRNGMLGPNYSSKFSPWLALGCLSPRQIQREVKRYEAERVRNDSTYWMTFELLWREYFRFVAAKHGDNLFRVGGIRQRPLPWRREQEPFDRWRNGRTGFPLIDANMIELKTTGFMSNRGRQNVASFLTKNLRIDWRMGAQWFESQLLDYDPCSNYGNWNYAAGIGNDARGFRWFEILKQAGQYDPDGSYVRHWISELRGVPDSLVHCPWEMSRDQQRLAGCVIGDDYPEPMVDLRASASESEKLYDHATCR